MLSRRRFAACALCAALGLAASAVGAQTAGVTRTILKRIEYPGDRHVTILVRAEIAPGAIVAWHTHPGVESTYILEGEGVFLMRGQPEQKVGPGDSFQVPPETPHSVRNGNQITRVVATYVVEKDKPLASPASG